MNSVSIKGSELVGGGRDVSSRRRRVSWLMPHLSWLMVCIIAEGESIMAQRFSCLHRRERRQAHGRRDEGEVSLLVTIIVKHVNKREWRPNYVSVPRSQEMRSLATTNNIHD